MGKNKGAGQPLTQEEIWDDSALVQSWDEAVEEYRLYHSIHAKGENVEDVLREAEAADQAEAEAAAAIGGAGSWTRVDVENDDDMADAEPATAAQVPEAATTSGSTQRLDQPRKDGSTAAWAAQAGGMPHPVFPQGRLDFVRLRGTC
ncbi:hypothetical protein ASPCAL03702 [Aspergillus calidoustus]|uniref:Survival Motor Neuron Gemin2-binding domain-containing protein n=1 Tax=Aspergillus calidoustus TaxID=454130 RepID=A0A0U4YZ03_ASPCI|nr:hypothetical protein ASPCAL03702 [Aspergillus calidoustus]